MDIRSSYQRLSIKVPLSPTADNDVRASWPEPTTENGVEELLQRLRSTQNIGAFIDTPAGRQIMAELKATVSREWFQDDLFASPDTYLHRCRSFLQSLLSLRADHRNLHQELLSNEEALASMTRSLEHARDPERLKRVENRVLRAEVRLQKTQEHLAAAVQQDSAAKTAKQNLYLSERAEMAPEVAREMSNLASMVQPQLQPAPDPKYADWIVKMGADSRHCGSYWGALGEGEKALRLLDRDRAKASFSEYADAMARSVLQVECALRDAADALDAASEAQSAHLASIKETELTIKAFQGRVLAFSGSYPERLAVVVREYAAIAHELERASAILSWVAKRYDLEFAPFSAAELLEGERSDEVILSEYSIALTQVALAWEDLQSRLVRSRRRMAVVLIPDARGKLSAEFELATENLQHATLEGLSLRADSGRNCSISYEVTKVVEKSSRYGLHAPATDLSRYVCTVDSQFDEQGQGVPERIEKAAFSHSFLPRTFRMSVDPNADERSVEVHIIFDVMGLPTRIRA